MSAARTQQRRSPNVLVFFTDQQRWDTVGAYGCPLDLTPNLDAAARRGVRFENAFTCQPVCAPARASLQTGLYATSTGVYRNGIALSPDAPTVARYFGAAGYETGYIGKWHLANTGTEPIPTHLRGGYEHWQASDLVEFTSHPDEGHLFDADNQKLPLKGYRVDAQTDLAAEFIRKPRARPFFLFLSFLEPHHQNDLNRFVAPEGYAARYANAWVPDDLIGRPGDWYSQLPDYYGIVRCLDECLGRLIAELEALGESDNTIVLFTTDHGCHFRSRNDEYKRSCHESSIRIPAAIWGPGIPEGKVVDELVSLVDLPPTLLDSAGIEPPVGMHGRSLMPLARGERVDRPEDVFVQISESEVGRALRTRRWKYSVYAPDRHPWDDSSSQVYEERYLYNLAADPHERVNLIGRKDHAEVTARLRSRLIERIVAAGEAPPEIRPARYPA
jgi:arylsulfatase A-like enzyme